jgi:hypothetical protein
MKVCVNLTDLFSVLDTGDYYSPFECIFAG